MPRVIVDKACNWIPLYASPGHVEVVVRVNNPGYNAADVFAMDYNHENPKRLFSQRVSDSFSARVRLRPGSVLLVFSSELNVSFAV